MIMEDHFCIISVFNTFIYVQEEKHELETRNEERG